MLRRADHRRTTHRLALWFVLVAAAIVALTAVASAPPATAGTATPSPGALEVIAVDAGQPARIVFAAPPRLATRTLTDADLEVTVDGAPREKVLRRLSANDVELAVVVDTTLDADELRTLQGAIVELALELPQGATMTIVDAQGEAAEPAVVPGPAIAAIRSLRPDTPDDLAAAVTRATAVLDGSQRDRTALLVVGRDLVDRLAPIDDRRVDSLSYLVSVGDGDPAGLLGLRAAGTAVVVGALGDVLGALDDVSSQLRSSYVVEIPTPDASPRTVTLRLSTDEATTPPVTVALDPEALRPSMVDPANGAPDTDGDAQADGGTSTVGVDAEPLPQSAAPGQDGLSAWVPRLLVGGVALALLAAVTWLLARGRGRGRFTALLARGRTSDAPAPFAEEVESSPLAVAAPDARTPDTDPPDIHAPDARTPDTDPPDIHAPDARTPTPTTPPESPTPPPPEPPQRAPRAPAAAMPEQPLSPIHPPRRRAPTRSQRQQRPIARLAPETREALSRAHLGLRQLALASRETTGMVPDDMFRLTEARASAALDGYDRPLRTVLLDMLSDDPDGTAVVVIRAAEALSTGWQHTARRNSAPPAVVEINAMLHGETQSTSRPSGRPTAPVRALNPLVEIGLEHMVLSAEPDTHAGMVARAVTAVDIMRAARLARPVLTLSPHLLETVERYRAACAGDPTDAAERDDWLQLLCDAIARRSHVSVEQLQRLRRIRGRYRDAAPSLPAARLIDVLIARPVLDARLVAERLSLSHDEASAVATAAAELGWLAPHPDGTEVWIAPEILDTFASAADTSAGTRQPA